jgi:hypothetical protein
MYCNAAQLLEHPYKIIFEILVYEIILTNSVAPEPEGSSPYLQEPAIGPYSEPNESSLHPQRISLKSILIPSSHLRLGIPSGLFAMGFSTKNFYSFFSSPMRATCPAQLIFLYFICLMAFRDEYKI